MSTPMDRMALANLPVCCPSVAFTLCHRHMVRQRWSLTSWARPVTRTN